MHLPEITRPVLIMAPLHGLTDYHLRQAFFQYFPGFDAAMAPFIATTQSQRPRKLHFRDLMPRDNAGMRLIPQILSHDPEGMLLTLAILADLGYSEVNWNLGCPFPRVVNKGRGCGLLPRPERILAILEAVLPRSPLPLSIKLRLGLRQNEECLALLPRLAGFPLTGITLHPRLGVQMYAGEVDLDGFSQALAVCSQPMTYNGDLFSLETYGALRKRFPGIGSWMIGRGALRDPFLPGSIKGLVLPGDPVARVKDFHDDLYRRYTLSLAGPVHVHNKMKELWQYLGAFFPGRERGLNTLARTRTADEYRQAVERIWDGPVP